MATEIEIEFDLVGTPLQGPQGPQGEAGPAGNDGKDGADGTNGINGINGRDGANGVDGTDGVDGIDGADGEDGLTAYELWLLQGNTGTVMDFLNSLVGPKGDKGDAGEDSTVPGPQGDQGIQGIQGPKGDDGDDGADGKSAYQVWLDAGNTGTVAQFLASLKGDKGDTGTQGIQGVKGDKGDKGEAGTGLTNRQNWVSGTTYSPGDYVFAPGSTAATSMWILSGDTDYLSTIQPNADLSHWIEFEAPAGADGAQGEAGTDGREVEMRNDGTNIQWRYTGDTAWTNLVALTAITGPKGDKGDTGTAGTNGTNGSTVLNGTVVPTGAVGANGDFYINTTTNLIYGPKAAGAWPGGVSLVGPQGSAGTAGTAGTNGTNGNTILTVSGTPASGTGVNGDYAYDPTTFTIYGPKTGGAWPSGTVIKGTNGTAGKGVSSAAVTYQAHTSGTTAPTGTWNASVPTVDKGAYLWTRTVTTYTDATTTTAYSVAYQGADGSGGSGGSSSAILTVATTNIIVQNNVPVTILTSPTLTANHAYMMRFRGILNDNANTKGIAFGIGSIGKRDMSLRVAYRIADGTLVTGNITEGDDAGATTAARVAFTGSVYNGSGNLITMEGMLTISSASALKVVAWNTDSQYDYRQFVAGAMLELVDMGAVTLT